MGQRRARSPRGVLLVLFVVILKVPVRKGVAYLLDPEPEDLQPAR